eukprot:13723278-Alexandrium_andersonii.AAC.1
MRSARPVRTRKGTSASSARQSLRMTCRGNTGSTWPNSARTLARWKRSTRPAARRGASSRAE